jgi:hypothetical protein
MEQITRTPKQLATLLRRRRHEIGLSQDGTLFDMPAALELELLVRPKDQRFTART